jgi:ParB/RepB/Spo0J family partition protein
MTSPAMLEPHSFSTMLPSMSKQDFEELVADIKDNGLHQPIVRYQEKVLDGNHRYRACVRLGIKPQFADFDGTDAQAQAYVISANIHRRHLTPEQKRDLIATLIKADPSKSNRQIAETVKGSHHTVEDVRADLESTGQVAQLEKTEGKDGKTRKRKGKGKSGAKGKSGKPEQEKITYSKVVDPITANRAYQLFEQHLLDAMQDLSDLYSPEYAEECARGTIEKLEKRLNPEEFEEETEAELTT